MKNEFWQFLQSHASFPVFVSNYFHPFWLVVKPSWGPMRINLCFLFTWPSLALLGSLCVGYGFPHLEIFFHLRVPQRPTWFLCLVGAYAMRTPAAWFQIRSYLSLARI